MGFVEKTHGKHYIIMARITLLWGPPCAGKTTAARKMKAPSDILLERDTMHSALTGLDTHTHTDNGMALVNAGYKAMLETAKDLKGQFIFVSGAATQEQRQPFIDAGAEMRLIYADRQTCLTRARAERPTQWQSYINNWFDRYENDQNLPTGVLI